MNVTVSREDRRADVEEWLRAPGQGDPVKDNRVRSVHLWRGLYVKRFKYPTLLQKLRGRLADKALREFRILRALHARGLDVPEPVAWARDDGSTYLFTREIPGARTLRSVPLTRPLVLDLARFVRRLHDAGLRDDDLHIGNVLLAGEKLHIIDLHRAAVVDGLTRAERVESLAFVLLSVTPFVSETDALRFVREYGADPRDVAAAFRAARLRYWKDRESRVRQTGSDFDVRGDLVLRRPFPEEEARRVFAAPPLRAVKELPGRRLWLADAKTFVKEGAPAIWRNAFALETRGIPTPRLYAVQGGRVAGEWLEGALPLWDHFKGRGVSRDLLHRLARLVRRLHQRGVYHRDLKANNILVRGDDLWVIDLDRVDFPREVARDARIWNLAQLNAAVGAPVTKSDRLRFLFAYALRDRVARTEWKTWVKDVMEKTRSRKHVWP